MSAIDKQRLTDLEKRVAELEKRLAALAPAPATAAPRPVPPRPAIPGQKRPPVMVPASKPATSAPPALVIDEALFAEQLEEEKGLEAMLSPSEPPTP